MLRSRLPSIGSSSPAFSPAISSMQSVIFWNSSVCRIFSIETSGPSDWPRFSRST